MPDACATYSKTVFHGNISHNLSTVDRKKSWKNQPYKNEYTGVEIILSQTVKVLSELIRMLTIIFHVNENISNRIPNKFTLNSSLIQKRKLETFMN